MASYCYSTYIADGYCLNFADSHGNRLVQQPNVMYVIGVMTGDVTMQEFAAYVAREKGFWSDASGMYDKSGNYPTLGRELVFLSMLDKFSKVGLANRRWLTTGCHDCRYSQHAETACLWQ